MPLLAKFAIDMIYDWSVFRLRTEEDKLSAPFNPDRVTWWRLRAADADLLLGRKAATSGFPDLSDNVPGHGGISFSQLRYGQLRQG